MENQEGKELSTLTIVNGGVEITVRHLDNTEERIKVRQLPLRHMAAYGEAQGNEARLCELFTGKDAEWVDSLSTASQEEVVSLGDRLNADFFLRWADRRMAANQKLRPLLPTLRSATSASPSSPAASIPPTS